MKLVPAAPKSGANLRPFVLPFLPSCPPLVPVVSADGEITPDVDRVLTVVARDAHDGDVAARNALYVALEPKIARFVRRLAGDLDRRGGCPAVDADDLGQEAFLVFARLVECWPAEGSFGAYFLGHFPWRLKNAGRRLETANRTVLDLSDAPSQSLLADGSADGDEASALLEAMAASLPVPDGDILRWRVRDREGLATIGRRLGVGRQAVARAWTRVAAELRRSLAPEGERRPARVRPQGVASASQAQVRWP
jgi:RNA polymerase sigma factor (sigma-70 family)